MLDLICCRDCGSPSCRGCNVKILDDLLESGVLDKFMDEHHTIQKEKIVDAVPVVHGEWITRKNWTHIVCSVCGFEVPYDVFAYCPNCGAKMGGGKKGRQ